MQNHKIFQLYRKDFILRNFKRLRSSCDNTVHTSINIKLTNVEYDTCINFHVHSNIKKLNLRLKIMQEHQSTEIYFKSILLQTNLKKCD